MQNSEFYLVNVFANGKFTGNQVIVFKAPMENPLSDEYMQSIAKEIGVSECIFILSGQQNNGGYLVRIFTATKELEYSGHPLLGAAYVICEFMNHCNTNTPNRIILNLKNSQVPVHVDRPSDGAPNFWLEESTPSFGKQYEKVLFSKILSIEPEEIDDKWPIQDISAGLPVIIVPIKNLRTMKDIKINLKRYNWFIQKADAKIIAAFCPETYDNNNQVNVRVFSDYYGIAEDSASGSANGCLGAYLINYKYFSKTEGSIRIEQGTEIGRPSLILAKGKKEGGKIKVEVGGRILLLAKGEFY